MSDARTLARGRALTIRNSVTSVSADQIRTVDIQVEDATEAFGPNIDAQYQATERLHAECVPETAETVVVEVTDAGGTVQTVRFQVHNQVRGQLQDEALAAAMGRAREKASRLATVEGLGVSDMQSITTKEVSTGMDSIVEEASEISPGMTSLQHNRRIGNGRSRLRTHRGVTTRMDEVAQNLFVGTTEDASDASTLREHDITVVVSLTHTGPDGDVPADVTLVEVPMMDGPQDSCDAFETAVGEVLARLDAGEVTLVHCAAGASRSPVVAATALAFHTSSDLTAAFQQIQDRRSAADPHDALLRQAASVYTRGHNAIGIT